MLQIADSQLLDRSTRCHATVMDRGSALWIPDQYVKLRTSPAERVMQLVDQCWASYGETQRRELAQMLLVLLSPLHDPGASITDQLRERCVQVVTAWIEEPRYAPR